ncbi:MAG: hypothetical protein PVF83_17660 [Anaerolineales bacterium]|jgi:uncharacterized protein YjgD (DUF1641 family)
MDKDIALLHEKIDRLTVQIEEQRKRQQSFDELKDDLLPIANHMIKLSIDELAEIGTDFRLEDLTFLFKRLLRNTHLFIKLVDQLEALMGLMEEIQLLGRPAFSKVVEKMDELERKGYFTFANQGLDIVDRIVTEFDERDMQTLAENVVSVLRIVNNFTQPDIMNLANNAINSLREEEITKASPSMLQLIREMNDPKVRIGLARIINLLKSLVDQPEAFIN